MTSREVTARAATTRSPSGHGLSQLRVVRVTECYRSAHCPIVIGWVGVLLRLAWYAERRPLWLDEAMLARRIIAVPVATLVSAPLGDAQVAPLGFLALERMAVVILGPGELALRAVPMLAAVASVFLFLLVARRTVSRRLLPMAMALFSVNRALVGYAGEAKQYSTDVAVALALWALWLVVRKPGTPQGTSWGRALVVGVAGAVAVWLSQPAVLVLGGLLGATLVLDGNVARRRMAAAAVVWGTSGAVAAWVAWHRVAVPDRHYLHAFWSAGFPTAGLGGVVWPVTAPAAALGSLMRAPPGVVWLLLGLVGLWFARRELLLGVGPVLATLGAAAVGLYPFADRLVLFLVPVALLLVATTLDTALSHGRVGLVLAACVLVPQLVLSLRPMPHEDMRTLVRAIVAERQVGDAIYVYYGGVPAFGYYASRAQTDVLYDAGGCHRDDGSAYLAELDRYTGRRLWLVLGHAFGGEDSLMTRYLGKVRPTLTTVTANDAFARLYAPDTGIQDAMAHPLLAKHRAGLACRSK